jgi:hypothetical protein
VASEEEEQILNERGNLNALKPRDVRDISRLARKKLVVSSKFSGERRQSGLPFVAQFSSNSPVFFHEILEGFVAILGSF